MTAKTSFVPGDLVFAKVKGYPAWPARITSQINTAKFRVFFYGTFERADIKKSELWPYNLENKNKFGPPNMKRKGSTGRALDKTSIISCTYLGYAEGLDQIEKEPDLAEVGDITSEVPEPDTAAATPPSNTRGVKRAAESEVEQSQPAAALSKSSVEEQSEEPVVTAAAPNTVSRSGRVIKPKKFGDDGAGPPNNNAALNNSKVDKIIEEPRKVWVKLKSSEDLVEINLDRDKPDR